MQGYPQEWIYIERKVLSDLQSSKIEGIKAPINFVGKGLSEVFKKDVLDVNARKIAMIRPVIGANGAGKTTQMEIQIKKYIQEIFQEKSIYLFFDFKYISNSKEEFWPIFIQRFYEQVHDNQYLQRLCSELSPMKLKSELMRKFKNGKLVEQIQDSLSNDDSIQAKAIEFFYGDEISSKDISDFFNGFLNLALDLGKLVVLCLDELQFLIDIDPTKTIVKILLEQFIRKLIEQFRNKKLYMIISCLQNPDRKEYDELKEISKNFKSIIEGKEIVLGNLTSSEKAAILDQVCEKVNMQPTEKKKFIKQVKSRLEYFLPRSLLKGIAEILDTKGYTCYSASELRILYEKEAREFIAPELKKRGFIHIADKPKNVGGYNIDIYASSGTERFKRTPHALGEATVRKRKGIKEKIEKFSSWLLQMKGKEYQPDKDYAFFICPSNRITSSSQDLLESNQINLYEFDSSLIDEINQMEQLEVLPDDTIEASLTPPTPIQADEPSSGLPEPPPSVIAKKSSKYKLEDIPGIGIKKADLLSKGNIHSIEDLLNCNPKIVAGQVKGLGVASLTKWIQNAKQILSD